MARFNVSKAVTEARTVASDSDTLQESTETSASKPTSKGSDADSKPAGKERARSGSTSKKPGRTAKGTQTEQSPTQDHDLSEPLPDEGKPKPPSKNGKRVAVPMPKDMRDALALARVDDDIEATVRIRAMVELWMHDERLRARVDKLAKTRSAELISHRWPTNANE